MNRVLSASILLTLAGLAAPSSAQLDQDLENQAAEAMRAKPLTGEEFDLVLEPELEVKVDGLIASLGSPDYVEREEAARELVEIGAATFSKLRAAYRDADDLETRLRIEEVVRSGYLNYHVLAKAGFLGISMGAYDPVVAEQTRQRITQQQVQQGRPPQKQPALPQLPPGRVGVFVSQVIPDTGAARAGIEREDVIIGIDGQPITGTGIEIRNSFSGIIRDLRPGARVELEVVRGSEVMTIPAILGRPPEDVAKASNIIVVSSLYRVAEERFQTWWKDYFARPADGATEQAAAPSAP